MRDLLSPPSHFKAVGFTRALQGLPLVAFERQLPRPGPSELLVRTVASSLDPLDYKLAELNFLGRSPPVGLGFDFSGIVIACGGAVKGLPAEPAVTSSSRNS